MEKPLFLYFTDVYQFFGIVLTCIISLGLTVILYSAARRRDMADLYTSNGTGKVSNTKFWANIAYFVSTIVFLKINFDPKHQELVTEIWLIYLGVVASNANVSKRLSIRHLNKNPPPEDNSDAEDLNDDDESTR